MRWEPGRGLIREAAHLERLARSAAQLGLPHDPRRIRQCLDAMEPSEGMLRVRLTLLPDGRCELAQQPFDPLPESTRWTLRIASTRIDPDDPLVRHKTTRRATYEAARAEYSSQEANEVVLLNNDGMVCEGTITNVFLRASLGILLTPPLSAGLLPGILRAELLAEGTAREAEITPGELERGEIFVGNSLRGLIQARMARGNK
jgi:4-amino-4-deoxychorismate lyase